MTTNELIELLKEVDPTGTAQVRMPTGAPYTLTLKDGMIGTPYTYIDNDGNLVLSTKGTKVEFTTIDVKSFVERNYRENMNWDEMKGLFKFELTYRNQNEIDVRTNSLLAVAKETFDNIKRAREMVDLNDEQKNSVNPIDRKKKPGLLKRWAIK